MAETAIQLRVNFNYIMLKTGLKCTFACFKYLLFHMVCTLITPSRPKNLKSS